MMLFSFLMFFVPAKIKNLNMYFKIFFIFAFIMGKVNKI